MDGLARVAAPTLTGTRGGRADIFVEVPRVVPSPGQVQCAVSIGVSTAGRGSAGLILQVAGRRVGPVGTGVLGGFGASTTLIIKRLQGGCHGSLVNAVFDLEIVGLLVEAGGIDVIGSGGREGRKIRPPDGVAGDSGGVGALAGDVGCGNRISQDTCAGVIDSDSGSGVRCEIGDLIVAGAVSKVVDLDMAQNECADGLLGKQANA